MRTILTIIALFPILCMSAGLPGVNIDTKDAIDQGDSVWVLQLSTLGTPEPVGGMSSSYQNAQVSIHEVLSGKAAKVGVYFRARTFDMPNLPPPVSLPEIGVKYIAIGQLHGKQFEIQKFLTYTDANMAEVKRLIELKVGHKGHFQAPPIGEVAAKAAQLVSPPQTEPLDLPLAGYRQIYWLVGGSLVLIALLWLWNRMRKPGT